MYRFFLFVVSVFLLGGCESIPKSYELNGTVSDIRFNGKMIYLSKVDGYELTNIDSSLVKENNFYFKGVQDAPAICYLRVRGEVAISYTPATFILENGKLDAKIGLLQSDVTGTTLNDSLVSFRKSVEKYVKGLSKIEAQYRKMEIDSSLTAEKEQHLFNEYNSLDNLKIKYIKSVIDQNLNNVLGAYIFCQNQNILDNHELEEILQKSGNIFRNQSDVKSVSERLKRIGGISAGKPFKDLQLKDVKGKKRNLSEYAGRGKFLIIDFWASDCPSSRVGIRDLMDIYKEYKYRGVDVLGISLDKDSSAWVTTIERMNLACPHLSDLNGWKSEVAKIYEVNRIPHIILLNPDGSIAARDMDNRQLKEKLQELLD